MAHHPGEVPRRADVVARPHLQPAAVRAIALGRAHQRGRLGHGGVSVGLPHRRPPVRVPAALGQVAGDLARADDRRRWSSPATGGSRVGGGAAARRRAASAMAATIAKNVAYAAALGCRFAAGQPAVVPRDGRVPALHPAVRAARGPDSRRAVAAARWRCRWRERQTSRGPRPSLREAMRALLLLSGSVTEDRFWSETWTSADRVLDAAHRLAAALARGRASSRSTKAGRDDRDVSVLVGRWAWLDVRALVEDHGGGKALLRVSTHLRPTSFGVVSARRAGGGAPGGGRHRRRAALAARRRIAAASLALAITAFVAWRTAQTTAILRRGVDAVAGPPRHDGDEIRAGARAAHRAVAAADLRPAQRGRSSSS